MKLPTSEYYDVKVDDQKWVIENFEELLWVMKLNNRNYKGLELPHINTTAFNVFSKETDANKKKMMNSKHLKGILPRRNDMMKGAE